MPEQFVHTDAFSREHGAELVADDIGAAVAGQINRDAEPRQRHGYAAAIAGERKFHSVNHAYASWRRQSRDRLAQDVELQIAEAQNVSHRDIVTAHAG